MAEQIRIDAAESLGILDPGNPEAIAALVQLTESTKQWFIYMKAVESLGKVGTGNPEAIATLVQVLNVTRKDCIRDPKPHLVGRLQAVEGLGKIGKGNPIAIATLVQVIESTEDKSLREQAVKSLGKIGTGNPEAIAALVQLIESTENWSIQAVESLGKVGTGNPEAIAILVQLIKSLKNEPTRLQWNKIICRQAAYNLKKILRDEQLAGVIADLKNYLSDEIYENDINRFEECYKLIWHCAQTMPYQNFYQAWYN
jgi:HEAT repeat protein